MHSKKRRISAAAILVVLLLAVSLTVSFFKFHSTNPFMTGYGLTRIFFTDQSYALINENPKVYIAKPQNAFQNLQAMMKNQGYIYNESKQLGAYTDFEKNGVDVIVIYNVNKYYSMWRFS